MIRYSVQMALLLDFYGDLLTEKQREYLELYYNEDFSLSEIAGPRGITPQGVRDVLQRGRATLEETEQKIGLIARFLEIEQAAGRIRARLETIAAQSGAEFAPLLAEIYQDLETLKGDGPHGV